MYLDKLLEKGQEVFDQQEGMAIQSHNPVL
jgi:hypothetical protein